MLTAKAREGFAGTKAGAFFPMGQNAQALVVGDRMDSAGTPVAAPSPPERHAMRSTIQAIGLAAIGLGAALVLPAVAHAATPANLDCGLVCAADCEGSCDPVCVAPLAGTDCERSGESARNDPCAQSCSLSPECDRPPPPDTCQA